jgi:hypothetical protein
METKSAASKNNPPTGSKSTPPKSNPPLESLSYEVAMMMIYEEREPNPPGFHDIFVPVNRIFDEPGARGMFTGIKQITWSDGDLFKDIEKKLMDQLMIEPQARERTYFRIFTNKELFDEPIGWYAMPFPESHVIVHSQEDVDPLFSDDTLDENKTGFVDNAVGIFVQNINSMWWLWPNKGKIRPPPKRR